MKHMHLCCWLAHDKGEVRASVASVMLVYGKIRYCNKAACANQGGENFGPKH
jgi:hypothetical protein